MLVRCPLTFLVFLILACDPNDDPPQDAAKDASAEASDASPDADAGRGCTAVFSAPAGDSSPLPSEQIDGEYDAADNPRLITEDADAFPFAVQAGEMRATQAVLWTRVEGLMDTPLSVRVWPEAQGDASTVQIVDGGAVTPDDDGFVHFVTTGLHPSTRYLYAFGTFDEAAPVRSAVGRFRTALGESETAQVRVAATTCTGAFNRAVNEAVKPYPALSKMAEENVDAILHLGDMSYNDGAKTAAEFHTEWEETRSQQGYLDLLSSSGMYAIWDDHEIDDDWSAEKPAEAVRVAGRTAYNQWLATERTGTDRLWTSYRWGQTVEFFLVDTRSERRQSTRESNAPVFVSEEQLAWLEQGLRDSKAHFKVVMTSVVIANLQGALYWDTPLARNDRWEGYGAQRDRLLNYIVDEKIDNVWFIAGDIHSAYVARLEPEGHPYARMWEIVVGPGASNVNPITVGIDNDLVDEEVVYPCNQFVFRHGRQHTETYLTFDPGSDTIRVVYEDAMSGELLYDAALRQEPR